jgi:hypothetical protein
VMGPAMLTTLVHIVARIKNLRSHSGSARHCCSTRCVALGALRLITDPWPST